MELKYLSEAQGQRQLRSTHEVAFAGGVTSEPQGRIAHYTRGNVALAITDEDAEPRSDE